MRSFKLKGFIYPLVLTAALMSIVALHAHAEDTQAEKININTASVNELQKLPQIGAVIARRIVDYREKNGKFTKIEDVMKVKGIGEKTFLKLKPLITVE